MPISWPRSSRRSRPTFHIVSGDRLGEPETNEELFILLERNGWITPSLATELRSMARLRNLLVYDYARIDLDEVEEVVRNHLGDLEAFVEAVRGGSDRLPIRARACRELRGGPQ